MEKNKIVVLSGGLDSVVMLHKHAKDVKMAIYFSYGQNQSKWEEYYSRINCEELGIPLKIIPVDFIKNLGTSMTSGDSSVPVEGDISTKMEVPFRNGVFFSIAVMMAESIGCSEIVTGTHFGSYPDNNPEFIALFNESLNKGTHNKVKINFEFAPLKKRDIVIEGIRLGVKFGKTWSCYRGGEIHCGKCKACIDRKNAFKVAGIEDPTDYEV